MRRHDLDGHDAIEANDREPLDYAHATSTHNSGDFIATNATERFWIVRSVLRSRALVVCDTGLDRNHRGLPQYFASQHAERRCRKNSLASFHTLASAAVLSSRSRHATQSSRCCCSSASSRALSCPRKNASKLIRDTAMLFRLCHDFRSQYSYPPSPDGGSPLGRFSTVWRRCTWLSP